MRRLIVSGIVVLLCLSRPLSAQEITGALQGRVLLSDSTPAPGVRLTLSGPNMQGLRTAESDARGFFAMRTVPPGVYQLRVSLLGYRSVVIQQLLVELGRVTGLQPVTLAAEPVEMADLVVEASAFSLNPVQTTAGGTLDAEDYATLPVGRDYKSLIPVLPMINESARGDAPNSAGSTGLENQYFIDGVNVSDTRAGDRATNLPYNFVRAVEVKTAGYGAQYGRALGAVVNAVTYSGTNDLEANIFAFIEPSALALEPRPLPGVSSGDAASYDVGARVSGPIAKDRLWYSAALNARGNNVDRVVAGVGTFPDQTSAWLFASKLTWRASDGTNIELSVFGDPTTQDAVDANLRPGITQFLNIDPLLSTVTGGGVTASLHGTMTPSPSLLLEGTVARQWDRSTQQGATATGRSDELYVDYVDGTMSGGLGYSIAEDRGRTSLVAKGTLTRGQHTVVGGAEYDLAEVTSKASSVGIFRFDVAAWELDSEAYQGTFQNRSPAVYLQDSWRITDRFTLNAGLRWSGQYLVGASGRVAQSIPDEWQPRLGFSWQLAGAGTQRVFGSYGRFYQLLTTNIAVLWFVDYPCSYTNYDTDPRQPGAVPTEVIDCSTLESDYAKQIPGLTAENFNEFTLGYERLLGRSATLTVRGLYRDLLSSFQWGLNFDADPVWAFGTPGQGDFAYLPAPKREYTALEISTEGGWPKVRMRASYVLSKLWGNYSGLYSSDIGLSNPGLNSGFWMPHQAVNSTGYLPGDHTHVIKLSGSYAAGFGLIAGAIVSVASGTPINEFGAGPAGPRSPWFLVPRGTAGRTPTLWNVDLRFTYDLPLRSGPRTSVQMDLLHVGNPQGTTWVDETHYLTTDTSSPNAQYLQPKAYQAPMAARLGIELNF